MIYTVIAFGFVGVVVLALSRRKVAAQPVCPNCLEPLDSFEVDRCPHCLLWQPPDRDAPTIQWRKRQAILGGLLIVLPAILLLLLSIVIEAIFAPPSISTPIVTQRNWRAPPPVPPALQSLSPKEINTLRGMGYLPGQWGAPTPQPGSSRKKLSDLPPHVIKALRSAGYLPSDYVEPAPEDGGEDVTKEEDPPDGKGG